MDLDSPPLSPVDEAARLRRCLNDLVSIMALPALWTGGEPSRIVDILLDALVGMLAPVFVFARLNDAEDGSPTEVGRVAESWESTLRTPAIGKALDALLGDASRNRPPATRVVIGGADLSIASARLGLQGDIGAIIVGSERIDFPGQTDRVILDVVANQAAIGLQQARLLSEQRRVAADLDARVAQRTRELAAANDELQKEIAERRRTEQALRANELSFQLTVDTLPGMVHTMTATGAVEFVNHQILDYFGKTLEELNDWERLVHPDDRARIIDLWTRSVATGEPYDTEHRVLRADGTYGWLHSRGLPLRDISGSIVRWYNLLTDIDERKRAEEALRESERESRLIVDTIPGVVAMLTPAGEVDFVNHQLVEYCGQPLEVIRHWGTNGTVHSEDLTRVAQVFTPAITSGTPYDFEARIRRFDGVYRWFQIRGLPLRDSNGHIARWYALLTDIDDRKRAEDAIRASERNLKLIIDTIPALAWSAHPDGSADFFNQHFLDFIGLSADEMSGWGWMAAVHHEDVNGLAATWQHIMASGVPGEAEARLRRHDGAYRWFLCRANPLRDESGAIIKWYGVNTDIEDRKRIEVELRRSEARKAAILDSALDCIVTIDHEGCITEFNPAAERTFSYRRADVLGQQLADVIIPPVLRERHRQGFARYLASGETRVLGKRIEMTAARADGSEFPVELAITRIPLDGPPSFTGYLRDIAERKRADEELRRSEAFLAEAQQLSRVGSFSWQVATDEIMWSEQLYRIFEISRDVRVTLEAIGTRIHPEDLSVFTEEVERSRRDSSDMQLEIRLQMPDGTVKYIHVVAHCRDENGRREYIGAVQDVTQRRLSEEALAKVRSELAYVARAASLGALTASIAHEVNQPLAGIITNASTCLRMLGTDPPDVDGARETARRTIRDGDRAADVITRLRALFSKREFMMELLDLNEATREVIALSSSDLQRHRVIVQPELAENLPIVSGDRIQLQQVILNLLRNAADAMVDVRGRPRLLLIKTEREDRNRVRLSVRDTGIGLPPQNLGSLFDAFYTTKSSGMGIGLFVSRSIVERHQGRLWAEPNDGPGATFSFSLPFQTT